MTLSPTSIQKPRSPRELLAFVESVRTLAETDTELRLAGHLRQGYLKEFFDEIVPLSRFAASAYPEDHTVRPILGNQGYDAEVRDSQGRLVDRVEIANPVDGRSISEAGHQLAEFGITDIQIREPGDDLEALIPTILRTASKKAIKDYSDTTVVLNVSACPAFKGFEKRHEEQVARIRNALADAGFLAKRVFVMLPSGQVERVDALKKLPSD